MKYFLIAILLVGAGCTFQDARPGNVKKVDKKFCVSVCRSSEFQNFHNRGRSWGAGSSSMGGLQQGEIYDRVTRECEKFYEKEECCLVNPGISGATPYIHDIHSHNFGACK